MSLAVLADHLASKGRNGDTMLVHMTPEEVGGLHALALAHGGSLTVNPDTGLVEASFLKKLLPAIAGFALAPLTAGTSLAFLGATPFASALTIGGITGLATGSLRQGIMAGLGAYGGASLGAGLTGAASAGATTAAAEAAKTAATEAAAQQLTGEAANQFVQQAASNAYSNFAAKPLLDQATGSFGALKNAGAMSSLARPAMFAAAPALLEPPKTMTPKPGMEFQYPPRIRPMSWNQYTGELEQLPMFSAINRVGTSSKEEQPPEGFKGGGIVALADGGFTDERVAQALRESMGQGFSLEQSLGGAASKFGISQDQLSRAQALLNAPAAPVAAAPAAGLPAIAAAQQQTFAPNVFTPGSLRGDVYGSFLKGQKTGNFADLQREIQEGKLTSTDIAALFPQLTKSGVEQFGRERGLTFYTKPQRLGWREMEPDNPLNRPANVQSDAFIQGINTALQQAGAPALNMPALQETANLAQPYRYRDMLAEAFDTAQMTGDYSNFNALLAERDVSKTELRNIFQNVTNPAIAEFEQRGLKFSALPDWIGQQGTVDYRGDFTPSNTPVDLGDGNKMDVATAENYARRWLDLYGRDISPQELRILKAKGTPPEQLNRIDLSALGKEPSQFDLLQAGVLPYVAGEPAKYDWSAIAASDNPIAAIQMANREVAPRGESPYYFDLGEVNGLKVQKFQPRANEATLMLNGKSIQNDAEFYKAILTYGLNSDEINRIADLMEASGVRYKPGEVFPGIDYGYDPRAIAAGSYGTTDYERLSNFPQFPNRLPDEAWLASQLGLALNREAMPEIGRPMFTPETVRPGVTKTGIPTRYAVLGPGGESATFFMDEEDARTRAPQQGFTGPVIDVSGRQPYATYTPAAPRPGDVVATPSSSLRGALEYLSKNVEQPVAAAVADAPRAQRSSAGLAALVADPTQQAVPTEAQLAAQRSILSDPVKAARAEALSGIAAGKTDQEIADAVNAKYGKSFSAQNIADFMKTQGIKRPAPTTVKPPVVNPPAVPQDSVTYGGTTTPTYTPVTSTPTYGEPFQPTPQTMEQVRSDYVQGGGRVSIPTIGDISPTDRIYTQNRVYQALTDYLRDNPNAIYGDVARLARELGVPEQQLRAAVNEFRFSALSGGSKSAYDYLMGRGAYPVNQSLPGGAPVMRPYADASGLAAYSRSTGAGGFFGRKTIPTEPSKSEAKGTTTGGKSGTVVWENTVTGARTVDIPSRYANDPEWRIVETKAAGGGLLRFAQGGMATDAAFNLGGYSDGGRLLRGPGDGVSDSIPATIGDRQPARLADGEFVVPARIVSEIGNGSTEAGARKLYKMMERVQRARAKTVGKGRSKVAKDTRAEKYLPA